MNAISVTQWVFFNDFVGLALRRRFLCVQSADEWLCDWLHLRRSCTVILFRLSHCLLASPPKSSVPAASPLCCLSFSALSLYTTHLLICRTQVSPSSFKSLNPSSILPSKPSACISIKRRKKLPRQFWPLMRAKPTVGLQWSVCVCKIVFSFSFLFSVSASLLGRRLPFCWGCFLAPLHYAEMSKTHIQQVFFFAGLLLTDRRGPTEIEIKSRKPTPSALLSM